MMHSNLELAANKKYHIKNVWCIASLVVGALLLRIIYLLQIYDNPFWIPKSMDPHFYHSWATAIVHKSFPEKTVFQGLPLYPYFLACIYAVFGIRVFIALFIQAIIGAISCGLTYVIAHRFFSQKIAFCAGLLAVFYKPFIFYDGLMVGACITIFLYLLNLLCAHNFYKSPTIKNAWVWGIQTGISFLSRPAIVLFPIIVLIMMKIKRGGGTTQPSFLKASLCVLLGMFAIVFLPMMRNYIVADDFILTSHGGLNFYIGNNPEATGKFHAPSDIGRQPETMVQNAHRIAEKNCGKKLKASESSHYWKQRAYNFIRKNPAAFLKLLCRKTYLFLQGGEITDFRTIEFFKRYSSLLRAPLFTFWMIVPWALLGLMVTRKHKDIFLLHCFLWSYCASIVLFFINSRYRLPVIPVMLIFAAYSFFSVVEQWSLNKKRFFILLACVVFLYCFTGFKKEQPYLADDYNELAGLYISEHNDYDKAVLLYRQAYQLDSQNQYVVYNLAKAYFDLKNYSESLRFFQYAVTLDKNDYEAYNFIGIILARMGKPDESIVSFEKVIHINPTYYRAYNNCAVSFIHLQQYAKAKEMLQQSIRINPQQPDIIQRLSDLSNR